MKATCIEWDVDYKWQLKELPTEIEIDLNDLDIEEGDDYEVICELVGDYISNVTGWCHNGFVLED